MNALSILRGGPLDGSIASRDKEASQELRMESDASGSYILVELRAAEGAELFPGLSTWPKAFYDWKPSA